MKIAELVRTDEDAAMECAAGTGQKRGPEQAACDSILCRITSFRGAKDLPP